jgi:hypothetical protein
MFKTRVIFNSFADAIIKTEFITYNATFKNKNCCESFDDFEEIYRNDFEEYTDD